MAEDTVAEGAAEASALQPQPYQASKPKRGKGKDKEKKDKDDSTPPVKRRVMETLPAVLLALLSTILHTLVQAILTYDEEDVPDLVRQIRAAEDLEVVAESILKRQKQLGSAASDNTTTSTGAESPFSDVPQFESELIGKISELRLDGAVKYVGGTSNLIFLPELSEDDEVYSEAESPGGKPDMEDGISSWTTVTENKELIRHLLTMYFTWHYAYFTTLSKELFYRDFIAGRPSQYCSALLVNAMLALGCHFSAWPASREDPNDSSTAGDHFFKEAKRLILENDEHTKAKLCTVQALALMSVREAGCGREGSGWVYSGMSFRMAYDLGLNVDSAGMGSYNLTAEDIDARRITFWGCFLFDKYVFFKPPVFLLHERAYIDICRCWSNYLGRQPQLCGPHITVPKFDVFPKEDSEIWSPYTDSGISDDYSQPSRTRAVALQISKLCEISNDLLGAFYNTGPSKQISKQEELRRLTQLHTRLEAWRKALPPEMEPKDGQLPQVLLMQYVIHKLPEIFPCSSTDGFNSMFFQLLFIHLYRPFLKYTKSTSPLPAHVSPRKLCTQGASVISKLLRLYKRTYGLRQICNIAVYIAHSACTIHLLNLPDKSARRDIAHGLKHLEEIAESWLCARRTLRILDLLSKRWKVELPEEALSVIERSHARFGSTSSWEQMQSPSSSGASPKLHDRVQASEQPMHTPTHEAAKSSTVSAVMNTQATSHTSTYSAPVQIPQEDVTQLQSSVSTEQLPAEHEVSSKSNESSTKQKLPTVPQPRMNTTPSIGNDIPIGLPQSPTFIDSDKLLQASQNWWLKDQNALALGMDNWSSSWGTPNEGTGNTMDYPTSGSNSIPPIEATDAYTTHAQQPMHIEGLLPTAAALGLSHPITSTGNYNSEFLASQNNPTHPNIANYMSQRGDGEYSEQSDMFY
ncbi:C6 transcription factor, putative [Trichophyton verrucosum HKI 0517]|uniref:C6 transcription factor, putative n=1 Tax=Trichophyton verrucosum (strain HKI 0517) TaxID=663202 RepID=D4D7T8_TRIVH|nr:C6 transcription factor, putative [Trichophyton verrucosum HKI 0517]EFE42093.1 C6 transcription factor, putative [Trichophyton verrucosum HKI 0517]